MKKFKEGDTVICIDDTDEGITIGNLYTLTETSQNAVYFLDDEGDCRYRPARLYQLFTIESGKKLIEEKQDQIKKINAEINRLDQAVKELEENSKVKRGDKYRNIENERDYTVTSFWVHDTQLHTLVSDLGTVWANPVDDINGVFGYGKEQFIKL